MRGADTEPLTILIQLISNIQRAEATAEKSFLPGDEVHLVGELPAGMADYDATWLRETVFIVRYVGDGDTIDMQPDLAEDFVIETVPTANTRPARTQRAR